CQRFGRLGLSLYSLCRGRDERPLQSARLRKSLSVEHTYASDLPDPAACECHLGELYQRLQLRLDAVPNPAVSKAFVKVKFADFTQTTLERSIPGCGDLATYQGLLRQALVRHRGAVRL